MATEASLTDQPGDKLVEELTHPKEAEVVTQGEELKMENLSTTKAPVAGSEGKKAEDNKESPSWEVKLDEVKTAPDDVSEKKEAAGEIRTHEKPEESTTVPDSQANGGEISANEITERQKEDKISDEFRTDGTAGEGSEIVEAGEGAFLVSKVPEGPIDTDPNAYANKAAEEEPIRKEEGSSPAVEEIVKEIIPGATFAAPARIIEEEAAETPLMEKEEAPKEAPKADEVSAVEEKKDETLRNSGVDGKKSSNEIRDETSKEETANFVTDSERTVPETADESSREETVNPVIYSGETRNEEMKKPEQTLTGENEETEAEKPAQKLPNEVSNEETVNAVLGSGESVEEDSKEDEKKSATADDGSKNEAVNPVMRAVENENETVTTVIDSEENKKQEVEKTDRGLPPQEGSKEITETKTVDETPKQEIPPAKQSKQSNNLISKVKHSMGKVKKAILGKSPSSKSGSTVDKNEINVK